MEFTSSETRFLSQKHGWMVSIEDLAIPPKILRGILERRARHLGKAFDQFREANNKEPNGEVVPIELEIAGAKLW